MADFKDRLYKELQTVEEFRFKFSMAKIAFVTALLGIGSVKLSGNSPDASRVLYLAPLVAVLFDILGMSATIAIYRIDAFLRAKGDTEEQWQTFLKGHQTSFSWWAAMGFTAITFLPSVYDLFRLRYPGLLTCHGFIAKILWLVCIATLWGLFRCWECQIKDCMKSIESLAYEGDYSLRWPFCGKTKKRQQ